MNDGVESSPGGFGRDAGRAEAGVRDGALLDSVDDGIFELDLAGEFVGVNDGLLAATGYDRAALLEEHVSCLPVADDEATLERALERLRSNPDSDVPPFEVRVETASGEELRWELQLSPVFDEGELVGTAGVAREVSGRDRKERGQQHRRVMRALEASHEGIGLLDESGTFIYVNDTYAETFGYSPEAMVGEHWEALGIEKNPEQFHEVVLPHIAEEGQWSGTTICVQSDGETFPAQHSLTHTDEDELICVIRDISYRRERERKLEESNERLEQFAYAASHDLQEPLRMVSSYLQLIEDRYADQLDEDGQEFLEFAVDGAERMREMIHGLLDYSRVETRGDPFEPVELDDVLADVCTDLERCIEESEAEIRADELPRVMGDRGQLSQLFQNLLVNAVEYSGDEPPRMHLSAERRTSEWAIAVADDGLGMDPGQADRAFELFQRLHPENDAGTGIGLALCERVVERHGGDIQVESAPGEGATFTFTLPAGGERDA